MVRVTLQALAAVLGGTQSLHTNSQDEALALPTEASARLALRTQQVIAYESGVAHTVDPLGGSYLIESLTDRLEDDARQYLEKIDALGGAVKALDAGYIQREIQDAAYRFQREVESGDQVIVGVNRFRMDDETPDSNFKMDPTLQSRQVEKLTRIRQERDLKRVERVLASLSKAVRQPEAPLMEPLLEAVEAYASLGEIIDVLTRQYGRYRPPVFI